MSRPESSASLQTAGFPRVSGDEPECTQAVEAFDQFSPRERG